MAADDGMKRVYFDSIGSIVPSPPGGVVQTPCVGPRCADALPPADRAQVPNAFRAAWSLLDGRRR